MRLLRPMTLVLLEIQTIQALAIARDSTAKQTGSPTIQDPSVWPTWQEQVGGWLSRHRSNFINVGAVLGGTWTAQQVLSRVLDAQVGKKAAEIMRQTPEQARENVRALTPEKRAQYLEKIAQVLHRQTDLNLDEARCVVKYAYPETGEYLRVETAKVFGILSEQCRHEVAEAQRGGQSGQQGPTHAEPDDGKRTKQTPDQAMEEVQGRMHSRINLPSFAPRRLVKSVAAYRPNVDTATLARGLSAFASNVGRAPRLKVAVGRI